jgi:hypothetical protein
VLREFTDPGRLAGLDPAQVRAEAATHGVGLHTAVAHCLVSTARVALTSEQGAAARVVLAEDLKLLEAVDEQVSMAEQRLGVLVARTPFAVLADHAGVEHGPRRWLRRGRLRSCPLPRRTGRSTGRRGCPRSSTPQQVSVAMVGSAGKARWRCAGRCLGSALACGATICRLAPGRPSCALEARPPA